MEYAVFPDDRLQVTKFSVLTHCFEELGSDSNRNKNVTQG